MLTLYSYPPLFGVADNNGYGLKVFAFLRLAGIPFRHEHIFDAGQAPCGQLPYIVDEGETVGDSETIIARLTGKYTVTLDAALAPAQRATLPPRSGGEGRRASAKLKCEPGWGTVCFISTEFEESPPRLLPTSRCSRGEGRSKRRGAAAVFTRHEGDKVGL
jgi:hypothetical protein